MLPEYYYYITNDNTSIPKPKLNGGHYTGEPFKKDAPWGTIPVTPSVQGMSEALIKYGDGSVRIKNHDIRTKSL